MSDTDQTQTGKLEILLTELQSMVEDLNAIVTAQSDKIARLEGRVEMLMLREAEREANEAQAPLADQRPPHW